MLKPPRILRDVSEAKCDIVALQVMVAVVMMMMVVVMMMMA